RPRRCRRCRDRAARRVARHLPDVRRDRDIPAHRGGGRTMSSPARPAATPPATTAPAGPRPHGPMGGMVGPPRKPVAFGSSVRRLLRRLRPERMPLAAAIGLTVASITLNVIGPRILGHATDLIFTGAMGQRLPAGLTKEQALDQLRDSGQRRRADM